MSKRQHEKKLRVGFVPLADCAPIVMAHELGFFKKQGLDIELSRELGWATVRDKIIHGELDASHALAPMPLVAALGMGSKEAECISAMILSRDGNGITLSMELADLLKKDAAAFKTKVTGCRGDKMMTFGVVANFSSHRHLMRLWLRSHGIDPDRDVRIVVVPPPQMAGNLKAGNLNGFCSGEPWNMVAETAKAGRCVATSRDIDPGHPEKILVVTKKFATNREDEHLSLIAALIESCEWCSEKENHRHLLSTLSRPEYVGVAAAVLQRGISELCFFPDRMSSEPTSETGAWIYNLVRTSGLCPAEVENKLSLKLARGVFRAELHGAAVERLHGYLKTNENQSKNETILH